MGRSPLAGENWDVSFFSFEDEERTMIDNLVRKKQNNCLLIIAYSNNVPENGEKMMIDDRYLYRYHMITE